MTQNSSETSTRISSDIDNNTMQLIISTFFLDKVAKARAAAKAVKQSKEQDYHRKKQDVKKSFANINAILKKKSSKKIISKSNTKSDTKSISKSKKNINTKNSSQYWTKYSTTNKTKTKTTRKRKRKRKIQRKKTDYSD